ncbi:sulfate/molybdate ABC transporter ATP-binding protein [Clostridium sp. Marseille-P2415]|uniref:sulfate/molybdate ABC transporter ATP-binding protein n=1 Tax=Clostridium sp. Marseille-P2415 TaxID=1805471 RepID=UPI0009883B80|nr:ATP-binding cassette domain-containing protein [Clostridium sp. Marseille-P2415]
MSLSVKIVKKLKDMTLDIDFHTAGDGGITGILGSSGCGKSMTLKSIAGIVTPDSGRIVLNDRVLFDSEKGVNVKIQDRGVGYLFQNYALFPHMTVMENVEMAVEGTKARKKELAEFYLHMFHIRELSGHYPGRLSGGQQQRAALARVMASRPSVLMLDEPFSALDYSLKEMLQLELLEELKTFEGEVLLVTHSRDEIYRFCESIHVINRGSIVASGGVKEVFKNPGTVSAARLTGCKNIAGIRYIGPHKIFVPDWGLTVIIKEREVPEEADHIGIRAHDLKKAMEGETENTMDCRLGRLLEDPFEVTLVMENGIWWKIPKNRWKAEMKENVPFRLVIPEESIFFLKDL